MREEVLAAILAADKELSRDEPKLQQILVCNLSTWD